MLWHNRAVVAKQGLLYPGYVHSAHFHAAIDLQRTRFEGWVAPLADSAWDRLVRHAMQWPGRSVISSELLAPADQAQADWARRSLDVAEVHVICTVRDLARQIPSVWQENIRNWHTESYPEFLAAIRRSAANPIGEKFWSFQDLSRVLATWGRDLPPERVHVITVPDAPSETLWRRFASVIGIDPASCARPDDSHYQSLGAPQTEVLRRINLAMPPSVGWTRYEAVVKDYLAAKVLTGQGDQARIALPPGDREWVRERAEQFVDHIAAAGYHVVGDLAELVPAAVSAMAPEPSDRELLDAAVSALADFAGRLPTNPDRDRTGERVKHALRSFSEQHPPAMTLRQWYWQGKARMSWARAR
jgi:hypothetical protein